MRYLFIDKNTVKRYDKNYLVIDNRQITYPSDDMLLKAGIKPLVVNEIPEYDDLTQELQIVYSDDGDFITQKYIVAEREMMSDEPFETRED